MAEADVPAAPLAADVPAAPLAADVPAAPSAVDAPAAPSAGEAGAADGAERPGPLIWHAEKKDAGSCVLLFLYFLQNMRARRKKKR